MVITTTAALLLAALPIAAGHGVEPTDVSGETGTPPPPIDAPLSYFRYGHYGGWMVAHIVLMVMAWVVVMALAIALSTARSRYHLPAQILFHVVNSLGVFTSIVYNHATPDLYKNDSHHPLGWVVTSFTILWTLVSLYTACGTHKSRRAAHMQIRGVIARSLAPFNTIQQHQQRCSDECFRIRLSRDSAMGSSRQDSSCSIDRKPEDPLSPKGDEKLVENEDDTEESEMRGFLGGNKVDGLMLRHVRRLMTPRASSSVRCSQISLEKMLLPLGFLAFATGFVVYGGISRNRHVFNTLAHFIKGGMFFWYGLLTLGRWMGAFTEFGWAWNIRPEYPLVARWKTRIPSAEFVECFIFWLYGATNVFLEHLNTWGKAWSPQDLEHLSITMLFFGGGLLGMLIESPWARELANTAVVLQKSKDEELAAEEPGQVWVKPDTYEISMNPMPGLVIMILGAMMSSHHQISIVSTMMHALWGRLFFVFACARAATYVLLYLKPPTSHFPARPPTELISAFCLTSGGLLFMLSSRDTVTAIESNGLDAMPIFIVTMGLTGVILAWEIVCFTIKGWALRKVRIAAGEPLA